MTMCEAKYPSAVAFNFLEVLKKEFSSQFSQSDIDKAQPYTFNPSFKIKISQKMDYYNKNQVQDDSLSRLKDGVNRLKNEVIEASELLGQRGEKINLMVEKAESIRTTSKSYYGAAKQVRSSVRWKRIKIIIFIVLILLVNI
jgi:hypothetical protein